MPRVRPPSSRNATTGAADAGELVALDDSGMIDTSMLPTPQEFAGTTWPSSPDDGQLYFKTDLSQPELFFWNSSTSKWLSVRVIEFVFVASVADGGAQWLEIGGAGKTSGGAIDFGYRCDHDLLLQTISFASSAVAASNYNYVVQKNGLNIAMGITHSTSISDGYASGFTQTTIAGDIIGCKGTNNLKVPLVVTVQARRRVTP